MIPYLNWDKDSACLISLGIEFHILTPRYDRDLECALGRYNLF